RRIFEIGREVRDGCDQYPEYEWKRYDEMTEDQSRICCCQTKPYEDKQHPDTEHDAGQQKRCGKKSIDRVASGEFVSGNGICRGDARKETATCHRCGHDDTDAKRLHE